MRRYRLESRWPSKEKPPLIRNRKGRGQGRNLGFFLAKILLFERLNLALRQSFREMISFMISLVPP